MTDLSGGSSNRFQYGKKMLHRLNQCFLLIMKALLVR